MQAAADRDRSIAPVLAVAGGAMVIAGAVLTWVSVEATPLSESVRGLQTPHGIVAVVCGAGILLWGILAWAGRPTAPIVPIALGIAAVVATTVAIAGRDTIGSEALAERIAEIESVSIEHARDLVDQARRFGTVETGGGTGAYLAVGGGLAAAAAGWIAAVGRTRRGASGGFGRSRVVVDVPASGDRGPTSGLPPAGREEPRRPPGGPPAGPDR